MKKFLLIDLIILSFLILMAVSTSKSYASKHALDGIVAVVNDDVITQSELNQALAMTKMQMLQTRAQQPSESVLHKQVLDQLVSKRLQLQIAKQAGVTISDRELNEAIGRIASQNNVSVDGLYQQIKREGMQATDYRNEIRDQMTLQKVQQQEIISRIRVSPEEVAGFMRSKTWQSKSNAPKEYRIDDILIPISDAPTSNELAKTKERAKRILAELNRGRSLASVSEAEGGSASIENQDIGWRKLDEMPSAFAEHIIRMRPHEIAGPIQTANGFHLLRLVEVRSNDTQQAIPNRQQAEQLLMQRKFEEAMQAWVSKLRGQAFISINSQKT